jgi:hypothetical protein
MEGVGPAVPTTGSLSGRELEGDRSLERSVVGHAKDAHPGAARPLEDSVVG